MKIEDCLKIPYRLEITEDTEKGGYTASYPDLDGCITSGETIEKAASAALETKKAWLEAAVKNGTDIPRPGSQKKYSGQFKFRMPKTLHRSLAEHAKAEGISMNQYCLFLLSRNDSIYNQLKNGS